MQTANPRWAKWLGWYTNLGLFDMCQLRHNTFDPRARFCEHSRSGEFFEPQLFIPPLRKKAHWTCHSERKSGRIPAYFTNKAFTSMIKRYSCPNCFYSFEKYFAPFEKFNTVECFLCKGAATVEVSPGGDVRLPEEPFLGFEKRVMAAPSILQTTRSSAIGLKRPKWVLES